MQYLTAMTKVPRFSMSIMLLDDHELKILKNAFQWIHCQPDQSVQELALQYNIHIYLAFFYFLLQNENGAEN